MGRWRPPPEKSSPYITAPGYRALEHELDGLWVRRREVTQHLSAAAAEGDRSENAEYIYRKKELRELDRRIRYLQKRLPELNIVRRVPDDPQKVFFGAQTELETATGEQLVCRIVGADELPLQNNSISVDSPLAKALLGKSLHDEVVVNTPQGEASYLITAVSYQQQES